MKYSLHQIHSCLNLQNHRLPCHIGHAVNVVHPWPELLLPGDQSFGFVKSQVCVSSRIVGGYIFTNGVHWCGFISIEG